MKVLGDLITNTACDNNIGTASQLPTTTSIQDSDRYKSPAYVGYSYGQVYESQSGSKSGTYLSDVDYTGGVYSLKAGGTTSGSLDPTHHYICDATCSTVRYYYNTGYYIAFITLTNGDTV